MPSLQMNGTMFLRKASDRGHTRIDWLDSYHTFSFGDYYDPAHHHFGVLRVINDDTVSPGGGFATHGHEDMEIITYVLSGALQHKDSLGNGSVIKPGEVQRMSAGTGIRHSEFNASQSEPVHFLQIWIFPEAKGLEPGYEQKQVVDPALLNAWQYLAHPQGEHGAIRLNQDAAMRMAYLNDNQPVSYNLEAGRMAWFHLACGSAVINGQTLQEGDGLAVRPESPEAMALDVSGDAAELIVFDLPYAS